MKGSSKIRFAYFDVGKVLVEDTCLYKRIDLSAKFGLSMKKLDEYFCKYRDVADLGHMSDQEFWLQSAKYAGLSQQTIEREAAKICDIEPHTHLISIAVKMMKSLRESGLPVGILSNDSREMAESKARAVGYRDFASSVVLSCDYAVAKPSQRIYEIALFEARRAVGADLRADEILFVDDLEENISAARSVGFVPLLFTTADGLGRALSELF